MIEQRLCVRGCGDSNTINVQVITTNCATGNPTGMNKTVQRDSFLRKFKAFLKKKKKPREVMFKLGLEEHRGVSLREKWSMVLQAERILCTKA